MKALFTNRSWSDWFGPWVVLPVTLLILWEVGVRAFGVDQRIVPAPSSVFVEMIVKAPLLASHAVPTLSAIFIGFIVSAVVGVLLGALLASSKLLDAAIFPLLIFSQAIPKIAIAPLLMIWFGFGIGSKILVSFLMAFFAVLMDTMVGIKAMPPELLQLARSMGARETTIFAKFRLPYALPYIFGGLRVASVFAVTGTVVAEFVGAENGLVYLMLVAQSSQQTSLVFAIVIILSVISIAMFEAVELIESRVVPWYRYRHAVAA